MSQPCLITSFVIPNKHIPSAFSPEERLDQTLRTIKSVLECGYSPIYLIEGSEERHLDFIRQFIGEYATVHSSRVRQYANKGISELLMIEDFLCNTQFHPSERIAKISGRYVASLNLSNHLNDYQFVGKLSGKGKMKFISSRHYAVANKDTYIKLVDEALRETFAFFARVNGRTSIRRILANSLLQRNDKFPYHDPPRGIEWSMAQAIENLDLRPLWLDRIGLRGSVAGCPGMYIDE